MLAFSAVSTNARPISYSESSSGKCKYNVNHGHVVGDKPDFVILVDGEGAGTGIAWFSETPGCFLLVNAYKVDATGIPSFTVNGVGGVQRTDGVLGFAHHFVLKRAPSWHYMAMNCRETCGLTGRTTTNIGETFSSSFVSNTKSFAFCGYWESEGRCPAMTQVSATREGRGAMLFGFDDAGAKDPLCSPYDNEFAYYDSEHKVSIRCLIKIQSRKYNLLTPATTALSSLSSRSTYYRNIAAALVTFQRSGTHATEDGAHAPTSFQLSTHPLVLLEGCFT
jgi:hypothetical protein